MIKTLNVLFAVSCIQYIVCDVLYCEPAKMNSRHSITFNVSADYQGNIEIRWSDEPVGQCPRYEECKTFDKNRYNITQTQVQENVIIEIVILNVTTELLLPGGYTSFSIQKPGTFFEAPCRFSLYSRFQNETCELHIFYGGFQIMCCANDFQQETACNFDVYLNGETKYLMENVSYNNERHPGETNNLENSCTLSVPKSALSPGMYHVNVAMFPKVTGTDSDVKLANHFTKTFKLEQPRVSIAHCPQVVYQKSLVACNCMLEASHAVNVSISWYDMRDQIKNHNPSHMITFHVDSKQPDYYCQATNAWLWKSEKLFYNLSVLYPGSVKKFTVNGESRTTFIINQSPSLHLYCETERNPSPVVKLLNGQTLLIQKSTTIEMTYNMSCNSYNVFHCIAEQENHLSCNTIYIYELCPMQLKGKPTNSTLQLYSMLNETVFIILDVYGYPKPRKYSLINNETFIIKFDNVSGGNAMESGYMISYQDEGSPYGRVNLSFDFLDEKRSANYIFILDNGIFPHLNYNFSIQTGTSTSVISEDVSSRFQPSVMAVVGIAGASAAIIFSIAVGCYCRRKVSCNHTQLQGKSSSDLYEEIVYEEIELNYQSQDNLQANNDNQIRVVIENIESRSHYNIIDESLVADDNLVNVRTNQYDVLDNELNVDYTKYNKPFKLFEWDTEYITVIDDFVLEENEYITVINDIALFENDYIHVIDEVILEDKDYIIVVDDYVFNTII